MDLGPSVASGASRDLPLQACGPFGLLVSGARKALWCPVLPVQPQRPEAHGILRSRAWHGEFWPRGAQGPGLALRDMFPCCVQTPRLPGLCVTCPLLRVKMEAVGGGSDHGCQATLWATGAGGVGVELVPVEGSVLLSPGKWHSPGVAESVPGHDPCTPCAFRSRVTART